MKRFLLSIIGSVLIFVIVIGLLVWYFFGGLITAIKPASENIAELILESELQQENTAVVSPASNETGMPLSLPDGFSISIFAQDLGSPRVMLRDPQGTLIVSVTKAGKVLALPDADQDGKADEVVTVADQLDLPHGLAFRCEEDPCQLYIAETGQVSIFDYNQETFTASNPQPIIDLPPNGRHFTRTIQFLPPPQQDRLLISIGSTCNVCYEEDWRIAKVLVANADGSDLKEYSTGLRNAVFLAVHPLTQDIWVTEMARDWLGNDLPPDEINILQERGDFGWPICFGKNIHDSDFDKNQYIKNPCEEPDTIPSHIDIPAHSSPLGLAFFPRQGWSEEWQYDLLVAFHGSWNRQPPTGYAIQHYNLDQEGNLISEQPFISGWLAENGEVLGRPAGILIDEEGQIFISDDKAGVIYLVSSRG